MDKQNYTLSKRECQVISEKVKDLKKRIIRIFRKYRLIQRKRTLKSYTVLFNAIYCYLTEAHSFQKLSDIMAMREGVQMSDISWRKHFLKAAPIFLEVAQELFTETHTDSTEMPPIYLLDATNFSMEGGNQTELRVHTQLSLNTGVPIFGKITDQHIGEAVSHFDIQEHALYMADRAYGKASQLAYLLEHKANFVIRITPQMIRLYKDSTCKDRLSCSKLLTGESFTRISYFSYNKKVYSVLLVGERIPEQKREQARKRAEHESKRKNRNTNPATLALAEWMIVAAPVKLSMQVDAYQLLKLYRSRWQIELFFKRAKTNLTLRRIHKGTHKYAQAVVSVWFAIALIIGVAQLIIAPLLHCNPSLFHSFFLLSSLLA